MNNHRSTCPDCGTALLSDLLHRIQACLKACPDKPLPTDLGEEIVRGGYQTLEEFKKQRDASDMKKSQQLVHDIARLEHMQKAGQEFDDSHPGGGPTYATKVS